MSADEPFRPENLDFGTAVRAGLSWAAGFVAGFVEAASSGELRRKRIAEDWNQVWQKWVLESVEGKARDGLAALRQALLGRSRAYVVSVLGSPSATLQSGSTPAPAGYWLADVWYYRPESGRHTGIAVVFVADAVSAVDPLMGPSL